MAILGYRTLDLALKWWRRSGGKKYEQRAARMSAKSRGEEWGNDWDLVFITSNGSPVTATTSVRA